MGTQERLELINDYNNLLQNFSAHEVLLFFNDKYHGKTAFSTSMGAEDQVITQMISHYKLDIRIFTLDTGRLFPETYELIEKTRNRYHILIEIYYPDTQKTEKMVNEHGINLFYRSIENRKLCCNIRKIEPLRRALQNTDIWITGLRSDQSVTRKDNHLVEWDENNKIIKVNPLINWSENDVWDYIKNNSIPYNKLHDQGFPSIGCQPCTRAIKSGEDLRAGRWWWENPDMKECGLHNNKNNNT
ncbi:MAG: phosphoadenylyl-sulfate reductase [Bacteroidetes bacterium]|nr:phosphoadenylyl-sulfate reductase [Bacteroidota bacterium]